MQVLNPASEARNLRQSAAANPLPVKAFTGQAERQGFSAHPSQGCSQEALVRTGGAGQIYCFAAN